MSPNVAIFAAEVFPLVVLVAEVVGEFFVREKVPVGVSLLLNGFPYVLKIAKSAVETTE